MIRGAASQYPDSAAARDRFVLDLRGAKAALDPHRAYAAVWEEERDEAGALAPTAVVFLTNRECPFRCAMCDLWVNTLDRTVTRVDPVTGTTSPPIAVTAAPARTVDTCGWAPKCWATTQPASHTAAPLSMWLGPITAAAPRRP